MMLLIFTTFLHICLILYCITLAYNLLVLGDGLQLTYLGITFSNGAVEEALWKHANKDDAVI
jgi:hypothetical protein